MSDSRIAPDGHENVVDVVRRLRGERHPPIFGSDLNLNGDPHSRVCANCSHVLRGQQTLNCPECGLWLATYYGDTTPWAEARRPVDSEEPQVTLSASAFRDTVWSVVRFERRIRLKTAMYPCSVDSRTFAIICSLIAAPLVGIASILIGFEFLQRQGWNPIVFLFGAFIAGCLSCVAVSMIALVLFKFLFTGRWKKRGYVFVPSAVHYSFAWLLPLSAAAALGSMLALIFNVSTLWVSIPPVGMGTFVWMSWLWDAVSQSASKMNFGARLAGLVIIGFVMSAVVGNLKLGSSPKTAKSGKTLQRSANPVVATVDWGSSMVQSLTTKVTQPPPRIAKTHVLIIDAIKDEGDALPESTLKKLGSATDRAFIVLRGEACNMHRIRQIFASVPSWMKPGDRFVLYINGHGMREGNGYIQMDDGWISSQMVSDLFSRIESPNCLLILDSCYSGNFVRSLRDSECAIVTSSDRQNVAFDMGLQQFWKSWCNIESDANHDGRIDVEEAFWHSLESVVDSNAKLRDEWLKSNATTTQGKLVAERGNTSPQFNAYGKAKATEFFIRYR